MHTSTTPTADRTSWRRTVGLAVGLTLLLSVLAIAFSWPATQLAPRDLPIVVAGPAPAAGHIVETLQAASPGAFAARVVPDETAARAAIGDRSAYGAVVLGQPPTVLTASAASPVVAQLLTQVATKLGAPANSTGQAAAPAVVDVVPVPAGDPRGTGLAALALPLVIGGLAIGIATSRLVRSIGRRVAGTALTAALSGLILSDIAHGWLGILTGNIWLEAGVLALGLASVSLLLVGLDAAVGRAGLALGVATIMLVGNPLSGMTSAPELLPSGWGRLGQWLPPGATGTLLRSVSFFDGAASLTPALVLAAYCVVGLALAGLVAARGAGAARHVSAPAAVSTRSLSAV